jgi:hypothetical protein
VCSRLGRVRPGRGARRDPGGARRRVAVRRLARVRRTLALPYTEGLFLASAGAALVCLQKRQWVWAGLLGAVASATRANGLAVVAAAVVAAVLAVLADREWRALLAPALSAAGPAAFVVYGWQRTGDVLVWRHAENLW